MEIYKSFIIRYNEKKLMPSGLVIEDPMLMIRTMAKDGADSVCIYDDEGRAVYSWYSGDDVIKHVSFEKLEL